MGNRNKPFLFYNNYLYLLVIKSLKKIYFHQINHKQVFSNLKY